ncbi:hypothetical protein [Streptomyces sp. NPDC020298]|uniref:COG4315 family predicted lipoprotein n=1 Tax=unclassified Streptomyces TaxID=2593676 RepID=UPI0033EF976E
MSVARVSDEGFLVADNGMTLYTFDKDRPGTSACTGLCADMWPPYKASATDAPEGRYSLVKRDDGTPQWCYNGKPLYFFSKDVNPGDKNSDNYNGLWHVVTP